jgi:REP element-mobilizing transposase RayT
MSYRDQMREWLLCKPVGKAFEAAFVYPELRSFSKSDIPSVMFYRRRLPHWELEGSTYFITFRLAGSCTWSLTEPIPQSTFTPAFIIEESLFFHYGKKFFTDAYVIMPDHIHLLIRPVNGWLLARILHGLKGFTAREINKAFGRSGSLWQPESFDHLVRNEADWLDKFDYIHNNPVKSGIVSDPRDYEFSSYVTLYSVGRLETLPKNQDWDHTDM